MRYDADNDRYEALNDADTLDETPIGRLRVIPWAHTASVALIDKDDDTVIRRVIHTLHVGENPVNAVYGKRFREGAVVTALYAARDAALGASEQRSAAAMSKDLVSDLDKLERRKDDGAEAVAAALGIVPWDVRD